MVVGVDQRGGLQLEMLLLRLLQLQMLLLLLLLLLLLQEVVLIASIHYAGSRVTKGAALCFGHIRQAMTHFQL